MNKTSRCPLCGDAQYSHKNKSVTMSYKGKRLTFTQSGFWCDACGEGVIDGKNRKQTRKHLQSFYSNIDGLLVPDEIRRIRRKLKLTQGKASQLFGGGVNAFSRYERGEIPIYRATSQLLRLLDKHPEQLSELIVAPDGKKFVELT